MTDRNRWEDERRWRADNNHRSSSDWGDSDRGARSGSGSYQGERQQGQQDWSSQHDTGSQSGSPGQSRSYGNTERDRGRYTGGAGYSSYGSSSSGQTGDYFGPGDYGAGATAWDRGGSQGGYGQSYGGSSYGSAGAYAPGSYDRDSNRQSYQRDSRSWGDRQQGGYGQDRGHERGLWDRASDEVMSWFGDEDAARRREEDHRGHGPADYTRSDERIREDANDRLTEDSRVDARNVSVTVKDGELTLSGTVGSRDAKHRAEDCVENISGVKHVQNNLRVDNSATGSTTASWNRTGTGDSARTTATGTAGATTRSGTPTAGS